MSNDTFPHVEFTGKGAIHGAVGGDWTSKEDAVHHIVGQAAGDTGSANYTAGAEWELGKESKYLIHDPATFSHQDNPGNLDYGIIGGRVESVSPSGASVSIQQSTPLKRFVADRSIPAVSSGTCYGALSLASDLVSAQRRCTLPGNFWSLEGHDSGFTADNDLVTPQDESVPTAIHDIAYGTDYVQYFPKVTDYASVYQWTDLTDGSAVGTGERIYAKAIYGSSPYPQIGVAHLAMFINLGGDARVDIVAGPDDANANTGMSGTMLLDRSAETITISGLYRYGGLVTPFSVSTDISSLDNTEPYQIAVAYGWIDSLTWGIKAWVRNGDGFTASGTTLAVTTGSMSSTLDKYAEPLSIGGTGDGVAGGTRFLYQERMSSAILTDSTIEDDYMVAYVTEQPFQYEAITSAYDMGHEPIARFDGSAWDYLSAVCSLFARNLRLDWEDGTTLICEPNDRSDIAFRDAEVQPQLTVNTDGIGRNIDYTLYSTEVVTNGVIYDAFETGEIWSVEAGEIKDIRITVDGSVTMTRNPLGAYSNDDYESLRDDYGSYIISAADGLPVQDYEWVYYGGKVLVPEAGAGYIILRLVGPPAGIPGIDGPFSLAVSDGETQYPRLTLIGSGVKESSSTVRRGTGADPDYTPQELATTINNPAISSHARMYTAHSWATKIHAGPKSVLAGRLPRDQWEDARFGLFAGSTFMYEGARWRMVSGTVSELGYSFTAYQFTTMADFENRWGGDTQDDFDAYWDGWQMKDFHISPLR